MNRQKKALVLFSGGLDSILAVKLLQGQKIKIKALIFKSYFWETDQAEKAAKRLKIPYQVIDFSVEHLALVKKPPHGYGKAANPCVDCHTLMLKQTKKIMAKKGFDFVATGEVLGERPFSQNKKALSLVAKESGLKDRLLRPLSAKVLPPTLPEKKGWVKREKLMAIQGRSRQQQIALAKKLKIKEYPQPAGGCLLCEKEFGKKLFKLLEKWPECNGNDIGLLRLGRHFWEGKTLIVLGKNHEENLKLAKLAQKKDILLKPQNFPGPTALIRNSKINQKKIKTAQKLILKLSSKASKQPQFVVE